MNFFFSVFVSVFNLFFLFFRIFIFFIFFLFGIVFWNYQMECAMSRGASQTIDIGNLHSLQLYIYIFFLYTYIYIYIYI